MTSKEDFPILQRCTYLDNAATTQKPRAVITAIQDFYEHDNANINRSAYQLAARATQLWEHTRALVAEYLGVSPRNIVFTSGTTEALNGVAMAWGLPKLQPGDEILLTPLEHHANILPWQRVAALTRARLVYAKLLPDGRLDTDDLFAKMTPKTRLLAITHVSNVLGIATPLAAIIPHAHERGIVVCVDGAQAAPHLQLNLSRLNPDFYAFSAHKMLGPTGLGVLYLADQHLTLPPYKLGGDMITEVTDTSASYADAPRRFEAGTQHLAGAAGFSAALRYLNDYGRERLRTHTEQLLRYAWRQLQEAGATLLGPPPENDPLIHERAAIISFTLPGIHPHDIGTILDDNGIAIRTGQHCAQPLLRRLGHHATCRASFYLYNDTADIDRLVAGLKKVREVFA